MNLGAVLGGLGGLLIPGGGALTAALGTFGGSLLSGSDPKNAIKDALIGGGIGGLFGGMKESVITFCTQIMDSFYFYVNDEEMLYMDEELLTLLYFNSKESFNNKIKLL